MKLFKCEYCQKMAAVSKALVIAAEVAFSSSANSLGDRSSGKPAPSDPREISVTL